MSQPLTSRRLTRDSLRGHEGARTVLLRMAHDEERADRIRALKKGRPGLTWGQIAEAVGVTERSAIDWQKTGGIDYDNAKKLAKFLGEDFDWLWSGVQPGTPDLMGALNGGPSDATQLDRIEDLLTRLVGALEAQGPEVLDRLRIGGQGPAEVLEEAADRVDAQQAQNVEVPARKSRSRRAS